ncbi:MAG: DbpA RNA binding domain-containing protein [Treponema sp.]|nr:DbpA RNA binding domain-containing protein [Treponema sp.]
MDIEKANRSLEAIFDKMYTDTDIKELQEYNKLFKKKISLFKRSWAAAWLFMYYDKKETPNFISQPDAKRAAVSSVKSKVDYESADKKNSSVSAEISLSEEESKRLFISIGKNRRLFPREVITLIMTNTSSAREDIGIIRILDNYSFVQVRDTRADEIIEALNGIKFRGRTLTVNFAKLKTAENESE